MTVLVKTILQPAAVAVAVAPSAVLPAISVLAVPAAVAVAAVPLVILNGRQKQIQVTTSSRPVAAAAARVLTEPGRPQVQEVS